MLPVHVQVPDGVLQAGLGPALRDRLGDGVDVELSDLWVIGSPAAWTQNFLELLVLLAARQKKGLSLRAQALR